MSLLFKVVEFLDDFKAEMVISILLLFLLRKIFSYFSSRPNIPGPFPWPVIGNALSLGDKPQQSMQAMAKKYGNIYLMKLGNVDVIVLNSYKVIRDALQRQGRVFSGRPQFNSFRQISQGRGIVFNSELSLGQKWTDMKRVVIKLLHRFTSKSETRGLLCRHVRTETLHLVKELCGKSKEENAAENIIQVGVANLVCAMMFGHRYEYSNKEFQDLVSLNREFGKVIGSGSQIDVMPWIKVIPKFANVVKTFDFLNNRTNNWMIARSKEHRQTYVHGVVRDVVDTYIAESIDNPKVNMTEEDVIALTTDVFGAGQDTLSTIIQWIFLYLIYFTDHQQKIKDELDRTLRGRRLPTIDDRHNFPFTEAVLHEIFRHSSFTPSTIPHSTTEPTTLGQYHIPENSIIFVNQYAANRDDGAWENADDFDPYRFLNSDGSLVHKPHERYLSFSTGIRKCPGDEISRLLLMHFMATFFSVAELEPDSDHPPELEGVYNLSMRPKQLKFTAKIRHPQVYANAFSHLEKVAVPVRENPTLNLDKTQNGESKANNKPTYKLGLESEFSDNDFEALEKVHRAVRRRKNGKMPLDDINGNEIYKLYIK
uniref:Cytochrome P450 1A1-like n=1 Tax=Phallusia mammillata TaxID=59560 RepID=A0A6F9DAW4_9ASCI|nr:cytochrome P450 1A1-like [Phallusia mammillata]